jgi:hypothetical protein
MKILFKDIEKYISGFLLLLMGLKTCRQKSEQERFSTGSYFLEQPNRKIQ